MNTKKVISSAALAASLTFAAGAAFAWGCWATVPAVKPVPKARIAAASTVPTE